MIFLKNIVLKDTPSSSSQKSSKKKENPCLIPHFKESHLLEAESLAIKNGKLKKKKPSKETVPKARNKTNKKPHAKSDGCWAPSHRDVSSERFELKMGRLKKKMSILFSLLKTEENSDEIQATKRSILSELVQISWEATPSVDVPILPFMVDAGYVHQRRYLTAILAALETENGKGDLISRKLGLDIKNILMGYSAWQGKVGAGAQSFSEVGIERRENHVDVLEEQKRKLNLYCAILGYLLRQDAVIWFFKQEPSIETDVGLGIEAEFHFKLNDRDFKEAYERIYSEFKTWNLAPGFTPEGFIVVNYDQNLNNRDFQNGMMNVFNSLNIGQGVKNKNMYKLIGQYISNDWKIFPDGEKYQELIQDEELLEWVSLIRKEKIDKVNEIFETATF